jgi:hypothetical protein
LSKSPDREKTYVLPRSGELDLKFTGTLLAEASEQSLYRCLFGRIYRTKGGSYVAELVTQSSVPDDKDVTRAAQCGDAAAILEFFTITRDPKKPKVRELLDVGKAALAKAGAVDPVLNDAHVETID